jgi:hypothetical protein
MPASLAVDLDRGAELAPGDDVDGRGRIARPDDDLAGGRAYRTRSGSMGISSAWPRTIRVDPAKTIDEPKRMVGSEEANDWHELRTHWLRSG